MTKKIEDVILNSNSSLGTNVGDIENELNIGRVEALTRSTFLFNKRQRQQSNKKTAKRKGKA